MVVLACVGWFVAVVAGVEKGMKELAALMMKEGATVKPKEKS